MNTLPYFAVTSLFISVVSAAVPQSRATAQNGNELYANALTATIDQMEKERGNIDDSSERRVRTDYKHVVVVENAEITDGLPAQSRSHQISYLDSAGLVQRYKALGKEFSVLEIHPIHSDGRILRIQISQSWFSYENGQSNLANSDWSDVEFSFDSKQKRFLIRRVSLGGI